MDDTALYTGSTEETGTAKGGGDFHRLFSRAKAFAQEEIGGFPLIERKEWQSGKERAKVSHERAFRIRFDLFQCLGFGDRERPHLTAQKKGHSERASGHFPHVAAERADVGACRAGDGETEERRLYLTEDQIINGDRTGRKLDGISFTRQLVGALAIHLDGRVGRGTLEDLSFE